MRSTIPTCSCSTPARKRGRKSCCLIVARFGPALGLLSLLLAGAACSSQPPPAAPPSASQPKPETKTPPPTPDPILSASHEWTREHALALLDDPAASVSAAVRLVRLADVQPLCVPDPLPPRLANHLRVVRLSDSMHALGRGAGDSAELRNPVLLDDEGVASLPVTGLEEELAILHLSADTDVFPNLLITPLRVMLIGQAATDALVGRALRGASFELRREEGYPFVALALAASEPVDAEHNRVEVARYTWDPFETSFTGPAADKLPDPPGGSFELDLDKSVTLIPVGGIIPKPTKNKPVVQPTPVDEDFQIE